MAVVAVVYRLGIGRTGQTVMIYDPVAVSATIVAQVGKRCAVFMTVHAGTGGIQDMVGSRTV